MIIQAAFVLCVAVAQAAVSEKACEAVFFDGKPYSEQLMKAGLYKPASLAVDHKTRTLYFNYLQRNSNVDYKTAKLDLTTKHLKQIDVDNGFSLAVDQKRHLAYIGGTKGLYKYDAASSKAKLILPAVSAWKLYFKDALYYIEFITQTVYKYADGKSKPFKGLLDTKVYYFAMDDDNYIVYSNGTGVFGKNKDSSEAVLYKEVKSVDEIREIALDRKGRFFVCSNDGVYRVDKVKQTLEKVADIQNAYGMTFDADNNLIFSKENELIRLVPNNDC